MNSNPKIGIWIDENYNIRGQNIYPNYFGAENIESRL